MKIQTGVEELSSGMFRAYIAVDGEDVHEVVAVSKPGALTALAGLTEADLDEAAAIHAAVHTTLIDTVRAEHEKHRKQVLDDLFDIKAEPKGN